MYSIDIIDGTAHLVLAGDIDLQTTADLKAEIQQLSGIVLLEINASSVRYIDSSGIAVLLIARQRCHEYGIELQVPVISAPVFRVLEVAKLDTLLPIGEVVPVEDAVTENFGLTTLDEVDQKAPKDKALTGSDIDNSLTDPDTDLSTDSETAPDIKPGTFR
ncbi:STAS domain-containing protein [Alphaproteobacteria bacterium LSUCC0684]